VGDATVEQATADAAQAVPEGAVVEKAFAMVFKSIKREGVHV
jgi:hypothetical protein